MKRLFVLCALLAAVCIGCGSDSGMAQPSDSGKAIEETGSPSGSGTAEQEEEAANPETGQQPEEQQKETADSAASDSDTAKGYWDGLTFRFDAANIGVVLPDQMQIVSAEDMDKMVGAGASDYYSFVAIEDYSKPEKMVLLRTITAFVIDGDGLSAEETLKEALPVIKQSNQAVSEVYTKTINGFDFAAVDAQREVNQKLMNELFLSYQSGDKIINITYTYNTLHEKELMETLDQFIISLDEL